MIVIRHHDFCAAHRIVGHPGQCRRLHGHNYRIHFHLTGKVNPVTGMVMDFSVIKGTLCTWIDMYWDHRTILWDEDPMIDELTSVVDKCCGIGSVVAVPFNPTAENMTQYVLDVVGPMVLPEDVVLETVTLEETRKCSVSTSLWEVERVVSQ